MALAIARLRLAALAALLRRPRGRRIRALLPWLAALVIAIAVLVLIVRGVVDSAVIPAAVLTVLTAWTGLVGSPDGALDARTVGALGVRWPTVALGIALGALVSPFTVIAIGVGVAAGVAAGSMWGGVLASMLLAATVALTRLVTDIGSVRESHAWIGVVGGIALSVAGLVPLLAGVDEGEATLASSPFAASVGWLAGGSLLVAILTVLVLALCWTTATWSRSRRPARHFTTQRLGIFAVTPSAKWSAVAARSSITWLHDARYRVTAAAVLLLPIVIAVPMWLAGLPVVAWTLVPVGLFALFLGWFGHNDLAYDGTAYWQHLAARVPGWQDRLGRLVPVAIVAVPLVALATAIGCWLYGDVSIFLAVFGAAIAILGAGMGVAAVTSALWPYPVVDPDGNPFTAPAAQSVSATLAQAAALMATLLLAAPVVVPVALSLQEPDPVWAAVGAVLAVTCVALGIWIGGMAVDRRSPELLAAAMRE